MSEEMTRTLNSDAGEQSLFHKICTALNTEQSEDESAEDFKIRAVTEFSNMEMWPDDKYETLAKDVQDWVYDATTTHKSNQTKKRKKALPILPGLDQVAAEKPARRGRVSLSEEPSKRGRSRTSGDDCLTRTMKLLVADSNPDNLKAVDLVKTLETKYGKEYSTAAVRYAQQAFITARNLLQQQQQQTATAA